MSCPHENYLVALVVPVYNEEQSISGFVQALLTALSPELPHLELVFVDDGSTDGTVARIEELLSPQEPLKVSLIRLSRNFGKEAAMTAALDLVDADAVIPMDVDLQDPPELVLDFIRIWKEEGVDDVYGIRTDRSFDPDTKRLTSEGFYYIFNKLTSKVRIPENVGDFRLLDRKVVLTLRQLGERNRFMKGLFAWPGFASRGVGYRRPGRAAGHSKWNYWKLWNFALDGIVAFSSLPLRVWSYIGCAVGLVAVVSMVVLILRVAFYGVDVPGYASLMCVILFLGAVQLISVGVLGEYLSRLTEEVKHRPVYVVSRISGPLSQRVAAGLNAASNGVVYNGEEPKSATASSRDQDASS